MQYLHLGFEISTIVLIDNVISLNLHVFPIQNNIWVLLKNGSFVKKQKGLTKKKQKLVVR
jgi:hypothetical protein